MKISEKYQPTTAKLQIDKLCSPISKEKEMWVQWTVLKTKRHNISEKPFGYPEAISESCLGYQKQLFRIWEQEFTSDFISYPKTFCRYERDIRN